jgi:DmsE family decaheme c-type cytochrome
MYKWISVALCAALAGVVLFGQTAPLPSAEETPKYAGAEVCFVCHIAFARRWGEVSHSKKLLDKALPADQRGCEACHGPGAAHVAGERKKIIAWDKLKAQQEWDICLKCHQKLLSAEHWKAGAHAALEVSCTQCHEVHKVVPQEHLLKQPVKETCDGCHEGMKAQIAEETHHPLPEGVLECGQCHNVHGTENPRALLGPQDEMCAMCHGDEVPKPDSHKNENWKKEHNEDAKQNQEKCLTCHSQEGFCNRCHIVPVPHPEEFVTQHGPTAKEHLQACRNCHEDDYCLVCHTEIPPKVEEGTEEEVPKVN